MRACVRVSTPPLSSTRPYTPARFWDLLERSHEASISVNVSSAAGGICAVEFAVQGKSGKGNQQLGAWGGWVWVWVRVCVYVGTCQFV